MNGINVLSCFDGMSCAQIALERAGIKVNNYYASEVDKYAIKVTQNNYPETNQIGDICTVPTYRSLKHMDLLIGGSPCQDVSFLGKQAGLDGTRSGLFSEFVRLKNGLNPKWFILENTRMSKDNQDIISSSMKCNPVSINSDLFVCQNRPRLYWTNIPIATLPERPDWNEKYYQWRRTYYRANKSGVCPTLTANMGTGGHNIPLHSEDKADKLSINELEALQGIPKGYTDGVSKSQAAKMIGNSFTVDVIAHILKGMEL